MDVPTTASSDASVERTDVSINAYEAFWECLESDDVSADFVQGIDQPVKDAYAQFWHDADS